MTNMNKEDFKKCADKLGIDSNIYGKKIKEGNDTYTIRGIKIESILFPIVVTRDSDGAQMKFKWNDSVKENIV